VRLCQIISRLGTVFDDMAQDFLARLSIVNRMNLSVVPGLG